MNQGTPPAPSTAGVAIIAEHLQPECRVEVHVEVSPTLSRERYEMATREIAKGVQLPGYRKGRAPFQYIHQRYEHQIEGRWSQLLAERAIESALPQCAHKPLEAGGRVEYRWDVRKRDEASTLIASYECFPQLSSEIDLGTLKFEVEMKPSLPEDAAMTVMGSEARRRAQPLDAADLSRAGDIVDFTIQTLTSPPVRYLEGRECPLTPKRVPDWALPHLLGLPTGRVEINLSRGEGEPSELCAVDLERIYPRVFPDDALAQQLGFDDLTSWRARIEHILRTRIDDEHRARGQRLLFDAICKSQPFEIPRSLLQRQLSIFEREGSMGDAERRERALGVQRSALWMAHWSATHADLVPESKIWDRVRQEAQKVSAATSSEEAMQQAKELYRMARWTLIAEAVLDGYLAKLGWLSDDPKPSPG